MRETLEREIKLDVDSGFRLPTISGARAQPPRTFTSIYFDTDDQRLSKLGITLRRRVEKRVGLWQLKLPHEDDRLEIEAEGPPKSPPADLAGLLMGVLRHRPLDEIARMRTRRSTYAVRENRQRVADIVLDHVTTLREGKSAGTFKEVEVELLAGADEHLQKIKELLLQAGAAPSDGRPKVFRMLGIDTAPPEVAGPGAPELVHLHAMIRAQTAALLGHDPGTRLGRNPEDLHQFRVAIRRLRSVLRTASGLLDETWAGHLRDELAWIGEITGKARDLDVMIDDLTGALEEIGEQGAAGASLVAFFEEERDNLRKELLDAMQSERYLGLLERLEEASTSLRVRPSAESLTEVASAEFKKLRRAMRDAGESPSGEELHKIRIQGKRARYAAELVEAIVGVAAGKFISKAKDFQDLLGVHQDSIVAEARIRSVPTVTTDPDAAFVAGRLVERLSLRRESVRAAIGDVWKPLEKRGVKIWA